MSLPLIRHCGSITLCFLLPSLVIAFLTYIVVGCSAFFWLLSLMLSSLVWAAIPPLHASARGWAIVPVGVIVQELARALFLRLYFRAERSFSVVSINAIVFPLVDLWSGVAAGAGYGAVQTFVYYAPILAHALGPGVLYSGHCSALSAFASGAWTAFLFNVLHILLMILAFDAYRQPRARPLRVAAVVLLHFAAASFTILNNIDEGCVMALPLIAGVVVVAAVWTVLVTHRPDYRSSKDRRGAYRPL